MDSSFALTLERDGATLVIRMTGELDIAHGTTVATAAPNLGVERPAAIVVDLRRLRFIDVHGAGSLLELIDELRSSGAPVRLLASDTVRRTLIALRLLTDLVLDTDDAS